MCTYVHIVVGPLALMDVCTNDKTYKTKNRGAGDQNLYHLCLVKIYEVHTPKNMHDEQQQRQPYASKHHLIIDNLMR